MTKFARLNVTVPVDDALPVGLVAEHLREALEGLGMVSLDLSPLPDDDASISNGEDAMLSAPRKGRIYWPAASVVRSVDRPPAASSAPPPRKRAQRAQEV